MLALQVSGGQIHVVSDHVHGGVARPTFHILLGKEGLKASKDVVVPLGSFLRKVLAFTEGRKGLKLVGEVPLLLLMNL
ncbi:MAG: hypothetical protein DDT18_01566 [Actinobacteria bacterium]|nr:hypothetical protein [Actinomycetota bacterium]